MTVIGEYPSGYYALRRKVGEEIKTELDRLVAAADRGEKKDRDEFLLDLKIFARELSNRSGLSLRAVHGLFEQHGVVFE